MRLVLTNNQRRDPVPLKWLTRCAARAARARRLPTQGTIVVSFIDDRTMRILHGRFLESRRATDVLSFRYVERRGARSGIIGEILIAPSAARRYATAHRIAYRDELARYLIHGLLHWLGHDDRTAEQQRTMRAMEDRLLARC